MLLWASTRLDGLITAERRTATIGRLRAIQRPDGGWSLPSLGSWKRRDGTPNDPEAASDGYATGVAVFVLRQAGIPATDPAIRRGVAWLLSHQRASGRWFTRSVNNDKAHYISHAGTAFAVLALQACGVADAESGHQEPARHVQGPGERPGFKTFLQVNEGTVPSIAFSPDGKTLAAGYLAIFNAGELDGGLVLWDVATGRRLLGTPLPVKEGGVQGVAFSPDGKTLAAGYTRRPEEGGVVLWDAITRGRLAGGPLRIREGGVVDLAISPDGKSMVAAIVTHRISGVVLWDIATRKRLADKPLPVKEGHVRKVAFSADSKSVAASYSHGRGVAGVVLWDVATRQRLAGRRSPWRRAPSGAWPSPATARPSPPGTPATMEVAWCCGTSPRASARPASPSR